MAGVVRDTNYSRMGIRPALVVRSCVAPRRIARFGVSWWWLLAISQYEIYSDAVHVITRKRLREFAARHRDAEGPLGAWYVIVSKTDFASFSDVKRVFRSVDKVGKFTVFDIGGNKFRLIAAMHYNRKKLYIRYVLTHAEYDKGKWKEQ